jgi:dihydrofolate reductase
MMDAAAWRELAQAETLMRITAFRLARRVTPRRPYLLMPWLENLVRLADENCRHARSTTSGTSLSRPQEVEVSASVLYMSMSLDGYIAGPNDEPGNPDGDGCDRLHDWFVTADGEFGRPAGPGGQLWDEMIATGAVLAGRRTVEQVDHRGGDAHGRPIFVPSHRPPGPSVANYPLVTYVTDGIASAMAQAKTAAGDRNVLVQRVHGATGARGRCAGRVGNSPDPGAVRWWPSAVRGLPSRPTRANNRTARCVRRRSC